MSNSKRANKERNSATRRLREIFARDIGPLLPGVRTPSHRDDWIDSDDSLPPVIIPPFPAPPTIIPDIPATPETDDNPVITRKPVIQPRLIRR